MPNLMLLSELYDEKPMELHTAQLIKNQLYSADYMPDVMMLTLLPQTEIINNNVTVIKSW